MQTSLLSVTVCTIFFLLLAVLCAGQEIPGQWISQSLRFTPRDKFGVVCDSNTVTIFGGRLSSSLFADTMYQYNIGSNLWKELYPSGDITPRFGGVMQRVDKNYYYIGGYLTGGDLTNEVWRLTTHDMHWTQLDTSEGAGVVAPTARGRLSSTTEGTNIFLFGGMTEALLSNEVWAYDVSKNNWTLANDGKGTAPTARFDPCCQYVAARKMSYCFGGTTDLGDVDELWEFSHATYKWRKVATDSSNANVTTRRLASCAALNDDTFIVFSGWDSGKATFADGTYVLAVDLNTGVWTNWEQPEPGVGAPLRDSAAFCNSGSGIFLLGGSTNYPKSGRLNDLWKLNGSNVLEVVQKSASRPLERQGHNAAVVGDNMYTLFGSTGSSRIVDPWRLDLPKMIGENTNHDQIWEKVSITSSFIPEGREGASVVAKGSLLYFFGGRLDSGAVTDEMVLFNVEAGSFSKVTQSAAAGAQAATPRQYHAAALFGSGTSRMFVMGGLTSTSSGSRSNDVFVFEFTSLQWLPVQIKSPAIPARSHHTISYDLAMNQLVIMNGFGTNTLLDKWKVTPTQDDGKDAWGFTFEKLPNQLGPLDPRQVFRGEHTTVGYGNRYYICGGSISKSFPTSRSDGCYEYNMATGKNTMFTVPPEYIASKSTAVYYGQSMILFGGEYATGAVKRKIPLSQLLVFKFAGNKMCSLRTDVPLNEKQFLDSDCLHCSPGTNNPTASVKASASSTSTVCVHAAAGSYAAKPFINSEECEKGSYSARTGARTREACNLCSVNTYADEKGSKECKKCTGFCALGSTSDTRSTQVVNSVEGVNSTQPEKYENEPIPIIIFVPIAGCCLAFILFAFFTICFGRRMKQRDRDFFFTNGNLAELEEIFVKYDVPGYGINEQMIFNALMEPVVRARPGFNIEMASRFFRNSDADGSGFLDFDEFLVLLISITYEGHASPQPGSPAEVYVKEHGALPNDVQTRITKKFNFNKFDMFLDAHRIGQMGDAIRLQRTSFGGMMTFTYVFLAIVLIASLTLTFVYSNLFETKSTMPYVVVGKQVTSELIIQITARGGALSKSSCVVPGTERDCSGGARYDFAGDKGHGVFDRTDEMNGCTFDPEQLSCKLSMRLFNFSIDGLHSETLTMQFGTAIFAQSVDVFMSFDTGILDIHGEDTQKSTASIHFKPNSPDLIFKGWPATKITSTLNPTYFSLEKPLTIRSPTPDTGYHLQVLDRVEGNTIDTTSFNQVYGLPISFLFEVSDVVLTVDRIPQQKALQFISAILGTISGLSAGVLTLVKFVDSYKTKQREAAFLAAAKKDEEMTVDPLRDDNGDILEASANDEIVGQPVDARRDRQLIDPLVVNGVNIAVAHKTLLLVRTVVSESLQLMTKRSGSIFKQVVGFGDDGDGETPSHQNGNPLVPVCPSPQKELEPDGDDMPTEMV